jgi:two-component system response regulator YesN
VDDEEKFRKNLESRINWEALGIVFAGEADNGEMALPIIRNLSPVIVICDIKMPVMDGIMLLKALSGRSDVRFIILSGYDDFTYTRQAIRFGAFDYILKPVNMEEISGVLMRAIESIAAKSPVSTAEALLDHYESPIIHFTESRNIASIEKCIEDYFTELPPGMDSEAYTVFLRLARKICGMFKLSESTLRYFLELPPTFDTNNKQVVRQDASFNVTRIFNRIVNELIASKDSEGKKIVAEIISQISNDCQRKYSLEIISKCYYINPSYFSQLFKKVMGKNFSAYLIGIRIEKAKQLLATGNFKIYEIAELSGYEDEKHFSQIFKKHTGLSPSDYFASVSNENEKNKHP